MSAFAYILRAKFCFCLALKNRFLHTHSNSGQEASALLLGLHDFAAFCRRRDGATTRRELQRLDWERQGDGVLVATVQADAFCRSMVRSLVGSMLAVGDSRRPVQWPASLLALHTRAEHLDVAPARGLVLEHIAYPPDNQLAARQQITRATRE